MGLPYLPDPVHSKHPPPRSAESSKEQWTHTSNGVRFERRLYPHWGHFCMPIHNSYLNLAYSANHLHDDLPLAATINAPHQQAGHTKAKALDRHPELDKEKSCVAEGVHTRRPYPHPSIRFQIEPGSVYIEY